MFCMNCGTKLPDGAKFCLECGTPAGNTKSSIKPESFSENKNNNSSIENAAQNADKEVSEFRPMFTAEDNDTFSEEESPESEEESGLYEDDDEDTDIEDNDDADEEEEDDTELDEDIDDDINEETDDDTDINEADSDNEDEYPDLSGLSVQHKSQAKESLDGFINEKQEELTPANDPYWDDVLPEINDELYQIPKDIIVKAVGIVVAVAASIVWLIVMLPN